MTSYHRLGACCLAMAACVLGPAPWAQAQPQQPTESPTQPAAYAASSGTPGADRSDAPRGKAEHERIRHEREALRAKQLQDEAACYQRFAVEDCLRKVRAGVRDAELRLRAREIELNDAERKEKAAERRKAIEEKQQQAVPPSGAAPADGTTPPAVLRNGGRAAPTPAHPATDAAQRDREAAQRAQEQRTRVQNQARETAARTAASNERAAQARAQHERALQAAQERRERVEKSRAESAARGHVPAAPLPPASAAP